MSADLFTHAAVAERPRRLVRGAATRPAAPPLKLVEARKKEMCCPLCVPELYFFFSFTKNTVGHRLEQDRNVLHMYCIQ